MSLKTEPSPGKVLQKTFINAATRLTWMLAPDLTMRLIMGLFFRPPQYKVADSDKQTLSEAESFSLLVNGKRVTGWIWGDGPAVMLLHGWGGSGAQFVPFVEPLIDAGFSVVTYDNPAHRHSSGRTTSYFEFVEAARAVYDHVGNLEGVVAHSMGSGAAMNLAQHTNVSVKFVFISPLYNLHDVLMDFVDDIGIYKVPFNTIIENLEKKLIAAQYVETWNQYFGSELFLDKSFYESQRLAENEEISTILFEASVEDYYTVLERNGNIRRRISRDGFNRRFRTFRAALEGV